MMRLILLLTLLGAPAFAGASGWSYFAPYQADTAAALDKLRWDVFRSGKYYKLNPRKKAKSPDHALRLGEEEGTHSIIDIGVYLVVYEGDTPKYYYFGGYSGD